jgi:hypothetical protein
MGHVRYGRSLGNTGHEVCILLNYEYFYSCWLQRSCGLNSEMKKHATVKLCPRFGETPKSGVFCGIFLVH